MMTHYLLNSHNDDNDCCDCRTRFVRTAHAELGGEDFGFMADVVPGAFAYIGRSLKEVKLIYTDPITSGD